MTAKRRRGREPAAIALRCCVLAAFVLAAAAPASAQTPLEESLARALGPHVAVWLHAGGARFLAAVATSTQPVPKGGVLLVPPPGVHLDWPQVVRPLRKGLARDGWTTLSLQMPPAGEPGIAKDAAARVRAGMAWLQQQGVKRPVLLGYGAAGRYLVPLAAGGAGVRALVLVSPLPLASGGAREDQALKTVKCPILEVVGSRDRRVVLDAVRAHARGADPKRYRRIVIDSAGYDYRDQEQALVGRVNGWLGKLAKTR